MSLNERSRSSLLALKEIGLIVSVPKMETKISNSRDLSYKGISTINFPFAH